MATLLLAVAICTMGGAAQAVNGREETAVRDLLPIVKIETFAQLTERSSLRKLLQDHNAVNPSDLDRSVWYTAEFEAPETLGPWWLALGDRYFVRGLVVVIANLTNGSADVYSGVEILRTSQIFQDSFWLEQTNVEPGAKFKIYITKKIGNSDFGLLKLHMSTGTAKVEFFSSIHMINAGYTGLLLALLIYSLIFFVRLRSPLHGFYGLYCVANGLLGFSTVGLVYNVDWFLPLGLYPQTMLTLILWFFAITGITFSVLYLEKKHRSPLLIQLLAAAFAAMFSIPVFRPFGDSSVLYVHIFNGLAAVLLALFISTLGLAWKRGSRDAPFLLLAFMPLMIVVALRLIISERGLLLDNGFQIGTVFEMLILAYGLTERVRRIRENGLRAMAENAAKSDYLANMAHELRAPLNAIIGFADVMKAGPLDKEQTEYIDYIHSSGDHLLTLINDLLDLSKIEAGRLELNEAQVDISKQLVRCLPFVKEVAALGDIQIESECPNDLPSIIADERMLRQMVINLLTNAVKFTPGGGRVTLSARRNQAGDLCIAVADTGYGMASEDIPVALRPYGQTARGRHMPGSTGLGLPLVKRMAELHGGSIWIDSKLDVGTTVTIRLPAARFEDAGGATV